MSAPDPATANRPASYEADPGALTAPTSPATQPAGKRPSVPARMAKEDVFHAVRSLGSSMTTRMLADSVAGPGLFQRQVVAAIEAQPGMTVQCWPPSTVYDTV